MALLRFISLVLIVVALMLLGADVVTTLEQGGQTMVRSFDQVLKLVGIDAMTALAQDAPSQFVALWTAVLSWPGWAVIGVPGALLGIVASGPRKPPKAPPAPPPIVR
jgi:hypothetical protein